ncbi:flagellar export chaperone FlgN [Aureliella helgolandensis]|uniref:FlgN protein n=1 Tax=Aureliella helgolandensis TaxID=2527968 RepID=A0A518GAP3_9BACT|nr:flagellar export chaperone FlgN [Aureliella helgolandensis]QDV25675.1 FlgN protein [Aureliella helgolandensis]
MTNLGDVTLRLESYLARLSDVNHRWETWLSQGEQAIVASDHDRLQTLTPEAETLMRELQQLILVRQQLLDEAQQGGLPNSDLSSLARHLPAWQAPSAALRQSLRKAKKQLSNLRRLHAATWVLLSQSAQYYGDMMQILMQGSARKDVYLQSAGSDTGGGMLLDTSL